MEEGKYRFTLRQFSNWIDNCLQRRAVQENEAVSKAEQSFLLALETSRGVRWDFI